ncbi:hypothetical protein D9613_001453 [Agrocybe pediades]|uniref:Uncharacterized protein n=1 Tax=Agrocybe pediades TaxID=84607 RepID=A0A8H4R836_9AGAR|nr:hypothetical protein D9613_001453 [Agrocybe pediades]
MRFATSISLLAAVVVGTSSVLANEIDDTNSLAARNSQSDLTVEAREEAIDNYIRELEATELESREVTGDISDLEARGRGGRGGAGRKGKGRKHRKHRKHGKGKKGRKHAQAAAGAEAGAGAGAEAGGAEAAAPAAEAGATEQAAREYVEEYLEARTRTSHPKPNVRQAVRKVANSHNLAKVAKAAVAAHQIVSQTTGGGMGGDTMMNPRDGEDEQPHHGHAGGQGAGGRGSHGGQRGGSHTRPQTRPRGGRPRGGNRGTHGNRGNRGTHSQRIQERDLLEARTRPKTQAQPKTKPVHRAAPRKGPSRSKAIGQIVGVGLSLHQTFGNNNQAPPQPAAVDTATPARREEGLVLSERDFLSLNEELEARSD